MLEKTTDAKPAIAKLYEERTTRIITTRGLHKALGALLADGYHSFVSDGHIWALPRGLAQIDAIDGWESGWQHGNLKNGVLMLHLTYPVEASGDQVMYALHDFAAEAFTPLDGEDTHEFITCQKRTKDGYLARVLVNRRGSNGTLASTHVTARTNWTYMRTVMAAAAQEHDINMIASREESSTAASPLSWNKALKAGWNPREYPYDGEPDTGPLGTFKVAIWGKGAYLRCLMEAPDGTRYSKNAYFDKGYVWPGGGVSMKDAECGLEV